MKRHIHPKLLEMANMKQQVTLQFYHSMENNIYPWSRSARLKRFCKLPINHNGQPFTGVSRWLLELAAIDQEFNGNLWNNNGEGTGVDIVIGTLVENRFQYYPVSLFYKDSYESYVVDYQKAQEFIDSTRCWIRYGLEPFYMRIICENKSKDFIRIPNIDDFSSVDAYWWTLFHEMIHWACYGFDRLDWDGDKHIAELVAYMGAAILADHFNIPSQDQIHSSNRLMWLYQMKHGSTYIFHAAEMADRAVNYLLNIRS